MASSKRQTTRAKMDREQAVRDRRARKQQRRDDKKNGLSTTELPDEDTTSAESTEDETPAA